MTQVWLSSKAAPTTAKHNINIQGQMHKKNLELAC